MTTNPNIQYLAALIERHRVALMVLCSVALMLAIALLFSPDALAAGEAPKELSEPGERIGNTLSAWSVTLYGGIIAIVGLIFLINRRYSELAIFVVAALAVGWLISGTGVKKAGTSIFDAILGTG